MVRYRRHLFARRCLPWAPPLWKTHAVEVGIVGPWASYWKIRAFSPTHTGPYWSWYWLDMADLYQVRCTTIFRRKCHTSWCPQGHLACVVHHNVHKMGMPSPQVTPWSAYYTKLEQSHRCATRFPRRGILSRSVWYDATTNALPFCSQGVGKAKAPVAHFVPFMRCAMLSAQCARHASDTNCSRYMYSEITHFV